jgi:hypothetical protein
LKIINILRKNNPEQNQLLSKMEPTNQTETNRSNKFFTSDPEDHFELSDEFEIFLDAVCTKDLATVKSFIENGFDVTQYDNMAIVSASKYSNLECVRALVLAGADVHVESDKPFLNSCSRTFPGMAEYFITECGVDINAQDGQGLLEACGNFKIHVVRFLLDRGLVLGEDLMIRAMSKCIEYDNFSCLDLLLNLGGSAEIAFRLFIARHLDDYNQSKTLRTICSRSINMKEIIESTPVPESEPRTDPYGEPYFDDENESDSEHMYELDKSMRTLRRNIYERTERLTRDLETSTARWKQIEKECAEKQTLDTDKSIERVKTGIFAMKEHIVKLRQENQVLRDQTGILKSQTSELKEKATELEKQKIQLADETADMEQKATELEQKSFSQAWMKDAEPYVDHCAL